MRLLTRDDLRRILAAVDAQLDRSVDLVLVGGGALLVLSPEARATHDLDVFPTPHLDGFEEALKSAVAGEVGAAVDINTRSVGFESLLPKDWRDRLVRSPEFSTRHIRVFTPAVEDLAVMKIFRFAAKDAEDIERLAAHPSFDRDVFIERFLEVLPVSIGDPRWHAQSFTLLWNGLYPGAPLETDALLEQAGIGR